MAAVGDMELNALTANAISQISLDLRDRPFLYKVFKSLI
jgi:hypothetical protein